MIETEVTLFINRKSDLDLIKGAVIAQKIPFPIYLFEYENHFKLTFVSDYEVREIDTAIVDSLPDYEFTEELVKGRKEIRLQISRYQSEYQTDGWGRPIEHPLNETKYLIRKSKSQTEEFNPNIKVLFENEERDYFVHIVDGVDKNSGNKGFLILNEFKSKELNSETEFFKDRLYSTPREAFQNGFYKMQDIVTKDFEQFEEDKKKARRKRERLPRKIIRDFIKSANSKDINGLLKNLHENLTFEKRVNWQTEFEITGKENIKRYFESQEEEFCRRDLKIRSTWDFSGSKVGIGVKYFAKRNGGYQSEKPSVEYRRIKFTLEGNFILAIIEEK